MVGLSDFRCMSDPAIRVSACLSRLTSLHSNTAHQQPLAYQTLWFFLSISYISYFSFRLRDFIFIHLLFLSTLQQSHTCFSSSTYKPSYSHHLRQRKPPHSQCFPSRCCCWPLQPWPWPPPSAEVPVAHQGPHLPLCPRLVVAVSVPREPIAIDESN